MKGLPKNRPKTPQEPQKGRKRGKVAKSTKTSLKSNPALNGDVACIIASLDVFFKGDFNKTDDWLRTPNPLLGKIRPWDMIEAGRENELLRWINQQMAENKPKSMAQNAINLGWRQK